MYPTTINNNTAPITTWLLTNRLSKGTPPLMTERRLPAQQTFSTKPLNTTPKEPKVGRPSKLVMPDMPTMPMTAGEQAMFDFWIAAFREQYPDLVPTDQLLLYLAGLEFIKYLRVIAEELETGKVISMARQHPGVNMRALLDQLSVTRKARTAGKQTDDETAKETRAKLDQLFGHLS